MKKNILIFSLPLLIFAFSCKKTTQPIQPPSVLYISGTITDKQTGSPLDSVKIYLEEFYYFSTSIKGVYYSENNGKFNFQLSKKEGKSYKLNFEKKDYCYAGCPPIYIDIDKEYQIFNVLLEK